MIQTFHFVVQLLSRVRLCDTVDWRTPRFPVFTVSLSLLKLVSIEAVMLPSHLILCLLLLLLPSVFPSTRVFSSELALHTDNHWEMLITVSIPLVTDTIVAEAPACSVMLTSI